MPEIEVRPVLTRRERREFLRLPWSIYRQIPQWVPPLRANQKELVGFARHPFYETASSQAFLAWKGTVPVGRILAIDNRAHSEKYPQDQCGFIGFFESADDAAVARALFDAAGAWLLERGHKFLRGPVNPSLNYECGMLVDAFDQMPTFMMPYNPAYYCQLWEAYGFEKIQDLFTFVGRREQLATLRKTIFSVAQQAKERFEVDLRPLDRRRFFQDVQSFLEIYNRSNEGNWGHVPLSQSEVRHISRGLKYLIVPRLTRIAEIHGKPVGATFGLLDYNPLIKEIDGRLFPFGFLKLFWKRRQLRRLRVISTNVLPEYKIWGLGVVLVAQLVPTAVEWKIDVGEFSWVLESNQLSRGTLEKGDMRRERTHRIYQRAIH